MSRTNGTRRSDALRALVDTPAARTLIEESADPLPDEVATWLGQLSLLQGLPFNLLVPDARMLPCESIRFFFLDQNWVAALVDGALSVVDVTGQDAAMLEILRPRVQDHAVAAAAAERPRRRRAAGARGLGDESSPPSPPLPWSGFLLRSAAVSDWPALNVKAFSDVPGKDPLSALRIERLSPTVLLAIFGGIAQRVTIAKPPQGLHFGVESDPNAGEYRVYLRGLGGNLVAGAQPPGDPFEEALFRNDPTRMVLDITALQASVTEGLGKAYEPDPAPPVDPGAFGLQMVAGAELQVFEPGGRQPKPPAETER